MRPTIADILIVEDDPEMERTVVEALHVFPDARVHRARSLAEARRSVQRHRVQLAVIDLGLPDGSGLALLEELARAPHALRPPVCVVHTVFDSDELLFAALAAGAQGYLLKAESPSSLRQRLLAAVDGEPAMSPSIARRVLTHFRRHTSAPSAPVAGARPPNAIAAGLTAREAEVLRAIAQGHTLGEVGAALSMSVNTVKSHVKSIYAQLNVSSRVAAADAARRLGVLDADRTDGTGGGS
jgi:DNA-binding NarL/FixJ family response regulator